MQIRRLLPGLVLPMAAALATSPVEAQVKSWNGSSTGSLEVPWSGESPVTFEGYYAHYRLDTAGERFGMNGVGARLMWRPAGDSRAVAPRFGLGVFGEYAPADDLGASLVHVGLQGDLELVTQPWFNRLTPIASLGASVLRTSVNAGSAPAPGTQLGLRSAPDPQPTTTLALTPAAGVRVALWRNLGLRADARDVLTLRDGMRHNWQFSAGFSFPF